MSIHPMAPLTWPAEVLVVGTRAHELTRGRHSEFLLAGITLTRAQSASEALVMLGDGRRVSAVLVGDVLPDLAVLDFGRILRTLVDVPVIYGVTRTQQDAPLPPIDALTSLAWLPVSPDRLRTAVAALQSACRPRPARLKTAGELVVDLDVAAVRWHGTPVRFGDQALRMIEHLVDAYPRIVPVDELDTVTGLATASRSGLTRVRVAIGRIRDQFAAAVPEWEPPVITVRGHGYGIGESVPCRSTLAAS